MRTKNGIELDLKKSIYKYNYKDYIFYFSSLLYLQKFCNVVDEYVNTETKKISIKYNININLDEYLYLAFYRKIEKRGFYVLYKNKEVKKYEINFVGEVKHGARIDKME